MFSKANRRSPSSSTRREHETSNLTNTPTTTTPRNNKKKKKRRNNNIRRNTLTSFLPIPLPIFGLFLVWWGGILFGYSRFYRSWRRQQQQQNLAQQQQHQSSSALLLDESYNHDDHDHHPKTSLSSVLAHHQHHQSQNNEEDKENEIVYQHHRIINKTNNDMAAFSSHDDEKNNNKFQLTVGEEEEEEEEEESDEEEDGEEDGDGDGDGEYSSEEEEDDDYSSSDDDSNTKEMEVIHIIHTRFMQQQPDLIELGLARLLLLKTIFLKSLQKQTTSNFIIVIRTDPNLHPTLKQALLKILQEEEIKQRREGEEDDGEVNEDPINILVLPTNDHPRINYPVIVNHLLNHNHHYNHHSQFNYPNNILDQSWLNNTVISARLNKDSDVWFGNVTRALEYLIPQSSPQSSSTNSNSGSSYDGDNNEGPDSSASSSSSLSSWGILETRLDADDGLSTLFVEAMQYDAIDNFFLGSEDIDTDPNISNNDNLNIINNASKWRIWCVGPHVEWQFDSPWRRELQKLQQKHNLHHHRQEQEDKIISEEQLQEEEQGAGSLVSLSITGCVSAGLTQAYSLNPTTTTGIPASLPMGGHQSLYHSVPLCRSQNFKKRTTKDNESSPRTTNCLSILDLKPAAIRARTITSAGMLNVLWNGERSATGTDYNGSSSETIDNNSTATAQTTTKTNNQKKKVYYNSKYIRGASKQKDLQNPLWELSEFSFGFSKDTAKSVHKYFHDHMFEIATDNLQGQCTHGHSCKNSTQILLQTIVDHYNNK